MTSDFRRGLCSAICSHTLAADGPTKAKLAAELDALPFERMGDTALLAMARRFVPAGRLQELLKLSPVRYAVEAETFLCPVCHDQHIVEVEPRRWDRCSNCNTVPTLEPEP